MSYTCEVQDSAAMAEQNAKDLRVGNVIKYVDETLEILGFGGYTYADQRIEMAEAFQNMLAAKISIPPSMALPTPVGEPDKQTKVLISNIQTTTALRDLTQAGYKTLALNFANGTSPGGGFLRGATAQEETICRQSGLYATLDDDEMFEYHHKNRLWNASSDWAILSPAVPFFRGADSGLLPEVWLGDVLTCAAPIAFRMEPEKANKLMRERIHRVLSIGQAYGYQAMVLGAWGCGAFGNDKASVAGFFKEALMGQFAGVFERVTFAIVDRSANRDTLGVFRDVLCEGV